jgi:predicted transcriptional regulator
VKSTFNWNPEQTLLEKLINLASKRGQSPESIISEAVKSYLETQLQETVNDDVSDPLIGLFAATPDLALNSEDILQNEVTEKSGWTWKEPQQ